MQLLDDPRHLQRQGGAVDGAQASDRLDLRLPFLHRRRDGRDGLRRLRHGGHELLDHGSPEIQKAKDPSEHQSNRNQHDYHAFGHSTLSLRDLRPTIPAPSLLAPLPPLPPFVGYSPSSFSRSAPCPPLPVAPLR